MQKMGNPTLSEKDKCPRCDGGKTLERDPEGDIHCWACGAIFQQKMSWDDRKLARHRFYEENKTAILADVQSIGPKATAKKWKVNGASLHHVLIRWELTASKEVEAKDVPVVAKTKSENGRLPRLPEFSMTWDPSTQLKWLEIYEKLLDRHSSENRHT